ncbi:hypothetical protein BJ123_12037 [Rhodopseudomonas thermotolerans]|uniref:Uncharacterized protein n=2 Tax=Rhodopseudomonas TaxID=1073 RepID=A0A336JUN4_9BRAD|nr:MULTISPECIES: hypothetical protein [Rhodopseudomonas]RED29041.1 hypothetical protein BJ125_12037 [Rhodopseudomonas pentothenatexigens]REF92278.1 hypothetical protein BJ123_12037 [Rhodopseudomonas thermotolerans]SSW92453.1 hypothetical protein SAMN05892882_12037 [Rhodopseudomonas pentothenatexigens]
MTRHALLIAAAIVLIPGLGYAQPGALDWQRYNVAAGSAAADVPRAIFSEDGGPAQDGPGRRFVSADGRADLTVQAVPNPDGASPAAFLARRNPPSGIIYRRVTPRFFAVSSIRNGRIWYNRCNRGRAVMNCVLINYPAAEKRKWDAIVTRISRSLGG